MSLAKDVGVSVRLMVPVLTIANVQFDCPRTKKCHTGYDVYEQSSQLAPLERMVIVRRARPVPRADAYLAGHPTPCRDQPFDSMCFQTKSLTKVCFLRQGFCVFETLKPWTQNVLGLRSERDSEREIS